jgi:D-alanyl-D-alanine carboxypeptidase
MEKHILYKNGILSYENNVDDDKLDENTKFLIGSITKIFTIYMILILQQKNFLKITDTIDKYIPSNECNDFSQTTIFEVMNHMSGLKSLPNNEKMIYPKKNEYKSATACLKSFINEKLFIHKKGTDNYSNIGYIILGSIIEKVTDLPFMESYKKYLFKPLGMTSTDIGEIETKLYSENCENIKEYENNFKYWGLSAGGLYSTVRDLLRFAVGSNDLLTIDSMENLKNIYIYKLDPSYDISHSGKIFGSHSRFKFTQKSNKIIVIHIEFRTCISIKKDINEYYEKIMN